MPPTDDDQQPPPLPTAKPKPKTLDDALAGMRPKAAPVAPKKKPRPSDDEFELTDDDVAPKPAKRVRPRNEDDEDDDRPVRRKRSRDDRPPPKKSNTLKILLIVGGVLGFIFLMCAGVFGYLVYSALQEKDRMEKMQPQTNFLPTPNGNAVQPQSKQITDWKKTFVKLVDEPSGIAADMPPDYVPISNTVRVNLNSYPIKGFEGTEGPMTYRVEWFDAPKDETYDSKVWIRFGTTPNVSMIGQPYIWRLGGTSMLYGKYQDGNPKKTTEVYVHRFDNAVSSRHYRYSTIASEDWMNYTGFFAPSKSAEFFNSIKLTYPKAAMPKKADPNVDPPAETTEPKRPGFLPTGPNPTPKMPKKDETTPPPADTPPPQSTVFREFLSKPKFSIDRHSAIVEFNPDEVLTFGMLRVNEKYEARAIVYDAKTFTKLRTYTLGGGIVDVTEAVVHPTSNRIYVVTSTSMASGPNRDKFLEPGQVACFDQELFRKPESTTPIKPTTISKFPAHVRALGVDSDGKTLFAALVNQDKNDKKIWKSRFVRLRADTLEATDELEYGAAILNATVSPDGKTIAVVEHPINIFGYVSYGIRAEGVVHFVNTAKWKNIGLAQVPAALSQAAFLDNETIVALSEASGSQQLLKIKTSGESTPFAPIKPSMPTGFLVYDAKSKRMIVSRRSLPGISIVENVGLDTSPKVFAFGITSAGNGPLTGQPTFLAAGKRFAVPNGSIYEFED